MTMSTATDRRPAAGLPEHGEPAPERRAPWGIVAAREIAVRLTDRNFLVSTLITLALLVGVFGLQVLLAGREQTRTVAVLDASARNVVESTASRVAAGDPDLRIEARAVADRAAGDQALRDESADALLVSSGDGWRLITVKEPDQELTARLGATIREATVSANAAAAGTSMEALARGSTLATASLEPVDSEGAGLRRTLGFVFAMLFYVAALTFGIQIANSVVEEKQSRIVEILATAIPVRQLLVGKVVGNTALALGQMALYAAVGLIGVGVTGQALSVSVLLGAVGWFLAFFLAGFVALACMWAVAGSLASRVEDLQSTTTPLTMVLVIAFFVGVSVDGTARVVASYVPVLSAITMPGRVAAGEAMWWEPVVSLVITFGLAALTILVGERLYRRSLLQTRGRVSLRSAWRTAG